MFTLGDLIKLMALVNPTISATVYGWKHGGGTGVVIGVLVGFFLSAICFLPIRVIVNWIYRRPNLPIHRETVGWIVAACLLVVGLITWIMGVTLFGAFVTENILKRLVSMHTA